MNYIITLTIAGSDCSGGAGIQADIKTFSALGCYAASAITAVTVQDTRGVESVHAVAPAVVAAQVKAVMDDLHPQAAKVGMAVDGPMVRAIADALDGADFPIVVDPVMVSTSGDRLLQADALETMRHVLVPRATLLTPNLPEAEALAGMTIADNADADEAAHRILAMGCQALLIKGGHRAGAYKTDRLYMAGGEVVEYTGQTVDTRNTHGTGCTLSAAITAYLARGLRLEEAVGAARHYLQQALEAGAEVVTGHGHGPVNHLFNPESLIIK